MVSRVKVFLNKLRQESTEKRQQRKISLKINKIHPLPNHNPLLDNHNLNPNLNKISDNHNLVSNLRTTLVFLRQWIFQVVQIPHPFQLFLQEVLRAGKLEMKISLVSSLR